jgi:hypothetical protein
MTVLLGFIAVKQELGIMGMAIAGMQRNLQ